MSKLAHFCVLSAFAVSGCLHTGGDPKPIKAQATLETLKLKSDKADFEKFNFRSSEGELDRAIAKKCNLGEEPPPQPAFVAAILPVVVSWVIDYAISTASSWAKQRLAEYSGVTTGTLSFGPLTELHFYEKAPPPELNVRCVRLRRFDTKNSGDVQKVASEAIVLVELTPAKDALLITPLRLYFDVPLARTSRETNAKFGVSLGVTFDALWQSELTGEGKAVRIWSETIAAQKIVNVNDEGAKRQRYFYYNLAGPDKDNPPVAVPLVPWSVPKRSAPAQNVGNGKLTLTLVEAGDPPLALEIVAGTLNDHGKDIGDFLKDAAKKALE